jgi:hypothetical protein
MAAWYTRLSLLLMVLALGVTILQPNIDRAEELASLASTEACEEGCEGTGAGDTFLTSGHPTVHHVHLQRGCARCALDAGELPSGATQEVVIPPPERGR